MATIEIIGGIKDHYTMIPNDILRDPNVSPRAVKLYGFLRSHSTGFKVNVRGIATQMNMGKNSVNTAIKELESLGYISREWKSEGNLRQGIIYKVFDSRCIHSRDTENSVYREFGLPETGTHKEDQFLKEDQSLKKTKDQTSFDPAFLEFWRHYPRKIGKGKAFQRFKEQIAITDKDTLIQAAKNFGKESVNTEKRYIPHPQTWLNQERWRDYMFNTADVLDALSFDEPEETEIPF